ncbi:hypothetical protein MPER_08370 [Moniliophthora perniciosa FA553]|nr:hypothetical protein MPER_08370 [Moniliophthora perniciosa FA553]
MSGADMDTTDQMDESTTTQVPTDGATLARSSSQAPQAPVAVPQAPKRRMVITHDKYMTLQSLIVLHLSEVEREAGEGIDKDELIDWYLEQKESEIQDIDELEYEKELITKVLRKLVKVGNLTENYDNYLMEVRGDVHDSLPDESSENVESSAQDGENVKVYYMVHPAVDTEGSSSFA